MKYHLILSIFVLLSLSNCDSVTSPNVENEKPNTTPTEEQATESPKLQHPENGAQNQELSTSLTWKEISEPVSYQLQVSSSETFEEVLVDQQTDTTAYQVRDLSEKTTYYWKVRAVNSDSSHSSWSNTWSFKTQSTSNNSEPVKTTLSAPSNTAGDQPTSPSLEWQEVSGATGYQVQLDTEESFSNPVKDQSVQSPSISLSGLDNETTYYWRVLPKTENGNVEWSDTWNFTTVANTDNNDGAGTTTPSSDMWISAYLASYNHYVEPTGNWGNLTTDEIDWDAFTHLFYFSLKAQPDGSLNAIEAFQNMSPDRINNIVTAAHNHNKPVIITIGGWGNYDGFSSAISPGVRSVFITNLVALIETWGFDGIDLDMEPIRAGDVSNYKAFVKELRAALNAVDTPLGDKPLLTAATADQPQMFADLQNYFDQINLMTYDYSGAWDGWVSWHNSALFDGGLSFPDDASRSLPSIDGTIREFANAGIAKSKLGLGIDFYGYVWSGGTGTSTGGVTAPNQGWDSAPTVTDNVAYHEIMDKYYQDDTYRWHEQANAPYISIDKPGDSDDKFISYDDSRAIKEKIKYIREQQLGGAIIWELSGGYRKDQPAGSRDKLLQTVKNEVW